MCLSVSHLHFLLSGYVKKVIKFNESREYTFKLDGDISKGSIHVIVENKNKAYFISPVVDMERLIADMMIWANVTEDELKEKKEIQTTFGETLSWDYLCYARENPIIWEIPTHILYGEKDNLTAYGTIFEFVQRTNSTLSIMKNGEHWFHTDEQMKFLDEWIIKSSK